MSVQPFACWRCSISGPTAQWAEAQNPLMGITPIMDWIRDHYKKNYAPNTRETVRRQTMHQFVDAGIALYNPDKPDRPVNSPAAVYQIEPAALTLLRSFDTQDDGTKNLTAYLAKRQTSAAQYAHERKQNLIPVQIAPGQEITLSPGEHSELIRAIIEDFARAFRPRRRTDLCGRHRREVGLLRCAHLLAKLGVNVDAHGKMPDVVLYYPERNWLLLVESVTSHGPVDGKRHAELARLFAKVDGRPGLRDRVSRTARTMSRYLGDIAWETEVWVADAPSSPDTLQRRAVSRALSAGLTLLDRQQLNAILHRAGLFPWYSRGGLYDRRRSLRLVRP